VAEADIQMLLPSGLQLPLLVIYDRISRKTFRHH